MQERRSSNRPIAVVDTPRLQEIDRRFQDRSAPFRRIFPARTLDGRLARLRLAVLALWGVTLAAAFFTLYAFARDGMSDLSYAGLMSTFALLLITLVTAQSYDTRLLELMREEAERVERSAREAQRAD